MAQSYRKLLKVSFPNGKGIFATIHYHNSIANIRVDKLDVVKEDGQFPSGIIHFQTSQASYKDAISKVEKYIESLLLKEMGEENASRDTSDEFLAITGRTKKSRSKGKAGKSERKGTASSLHSGSGRNKYPEGSGEGTSASEMAESSDPANSGTDQRRNKVF